MNSRTKIMRKLHAAFKAKYEVRDPHTDLHRLAAAEFGVDSMAHLSEKELALLYHKIKDNYVDFKKLEDEAGITTIPEMSQAQLKLVKKLQKELNWSDDYLIEIAIRRYGYLHWRYLTGKSAWAYCNYLIKRKREKNAREKVSA